MLCSQGQRQELLLSRWLPVLVLSVDQLVAWGVLYYAYTVLSASISDGLGLSRSFVAGGFSAALLVNGLLASRIGGRLDALGPKGVLRAGALASVLAMAALAGAQGPISLLLAFSLLGVAQSMSLYEPAFRAVIDWFPQEPSRARALLLVTVVAGLASAAFVPLTAALVLRSGWRNASLLLASGAACVLIPARWRMPLSSRALAESRPPAAASRSASWLAVAFALCALASTALTLHLVWQRVERGDDLAHAAGVAGLMGASQVPGRIGIWLLRGRAGAHILPTLLCVQAGAALGIALGGEPLATICAVLFGGASGVMTLERAQVLLTWYGRERFGAHNGRISAASVLPKAAAPVLVEILRAFASYSDLFVACAAALVLSAGCASAATRARRAEGPLP